jgi:hypothetical protein
MSYCWSRYTWRRSEAPLAREEMLDAPLLQLHGCSLSLTCFEGCTKPGSLSLQQMAASYGKGLQLRRALSRLRCRGCRRPPAAVTICDHPTQTHCLRGGHETSEAEATAQALFFIARDVALDRFPGQIEPKHLRDRLTEACMEHLRGKWKPTEANIQKQYLQHRLRRVSPGR